MSVTRAPLPLCGGYYEDPNLPISAQACLNWIPQFPQSDNESLSQEVLVPAPGQILCTLTASEGSISGQVRGFALMNNTIYVVIGTELFEMTQNGASPTDLLLKPLGTLTPGGRVSMASNGFWLVIVVPGATAWAYNWQTEEFAQITDENFEPANCVVFKDGYFVFTQTNGQYFLNSELNNPLVIDPLSANTAEIKPDYIYNAMVSHNELFINGEQTIEIFQTNQTGDASPFTRIPGGLIEKGVHCIFGTVIFDNSFVFIGGGPEEQTSIWLVTGSSTVKKIATIAIDNAIQQFSRAEIENAYAMAYTDYTGTFCSFTFLSDRIPSITFVYDALSSANRGSPVWHQRQSGINPNSWNVTNIIEGYEALYVSSDNSNATTPIIALLSPNCYTEYGPSSYPSPTPLASSYGTILRQRAGSPNSNTGKSIFMGDVEVTMRPGSGYQSSPYVDGLDPSNAVDPKLLLEWSDDGGFTWNPRSPKSIGVIGAYMQRLNWSRNGRASRYRCYRVSTSAPVPAAIVNMQTWAEGGIQ